MEKIIYKVIVYTFAPIIRIAIVAHIKQIRQFFLTISQQ